MIHRVGFFTWNKYKPVRLVYLQLCFCQLIIIAFLCFAFGETNANDQTPPSLCRHIACKGKKHCRQNKCYTTVRDTKRIQHLLFKVICNFYSHFLFRTTGTPINGRNNLSPSFFLATFFSYWSLSCIFLCLYHKANVYSPIKFGFPFFHKCSYTFFIVVGFVVCC